MLEQKIRNALQTWKDINTCDTPSGGRRWAAHTDALLDLEAELQPKSEENMYIIDDIVEWIVNEAKHRLEQEACCPGGLRAKIHGVAMELELKICDVMRDVK
jgi:hypothetical protein